MTSNQLESGGAALLRKSQHFSGDNSGVFGSFGSPRRTNSPPKTLSPRAARPESVSASKLYRDISPTRVYQQANAGDAARCSLPDLFRKIGSLESLRPTYSLDVEARGAGDERQPRLLQRLEALLDEKLSLVEKVGAASKGFAATQMRTDAYRQVFDAFLHSFTTYRSLLMRIKSEYDAALDDALASVYDNVHMRAELAIAEERLDTAIRQAKQRALDDVAASRKEIQDEVEQQEMMAVEAEARCAAADAEMQVIRARIAKLREEDAALAKQNAVAKQQLLMASSFATPALLQQYSTGQQQPEQLQAAGPSR